MNYIVQLCAACVDRNMKNIIYRSITASYSIKHLLEKHNISFFVFAFPPHLIKLECCICPEYTERDNATGHSPKSTRFDVCVFLFTTNRTEIWISCHWWPELFLALGYTTLSFSKKIAPACLVIASASGRKLTFLLKRAVNLSHTLSVVAKSPIICVA